MEEVTKGKRHIQEKNLRESEAVINHYHMWTGGVGNTEDTVDCQPLWKKETTATRVEKDVQLHLATAVRIAHMCS